MKTKMRSVHWIPPAAAVSGLIVASVVFAHEGHGGKEVGPYDLDTPRQVSPETAAHIGLMTVEVDFGSVEDVLTLSGVVRANPDRHWTISPRTAGKILTVKVQVGDAVLTGDLLLEIDSPELAKNIYEVRKLESEYQKLLTDVIRAEGRVEQLRVESENTAATASLVEAELSRIEAVGDKATPLNEISERRIAALKSRGDAKLRAVDLTVAIREAEALKTQVDALRLSRDSLLALTNVEPDQQSAVTRPGEEQRLNIVRLVAPADGVVVERTARPGHWTAAGESLLSLADYSAVQIEGELPESLIARVTGRSSNVVRVRTPADPAFLGEGTVKFISPVLDAVKRTAHVIIEAPNATATLREAMFVDLAIVLRDEKQAVVVPASAVIQDGPMHFVFAKNGDVYKKQDINPGLRNDQVIEVLAGLAPGDTVVSQGAYSLTQLRPKAIPTVAAVTPKPEAGDKHP